MDSTMETIYSQRKRTLEDSLEGSGDTYNDFDISEIQPTSITSLDEEIIESISSKYPGGLQLNDDQLFSYLSNSNSIINNFETSGILSPSSDFLSSPTSPFSPTSNTSPPPSYSIPNNSIANASNSQPFNFANNPLLSNLMTVQANYGGFPSNTAIPNNSNNNMANNNNNNNNNTTQNNNNNNNTLNTINSSHSVPISLLQSNGNNINNVPFSNTPLGNGPLSASNSRANIMKNGTVGVGIGVNNQASKQLLFEISEITKRVGIQLEKVYWEQKTITNSLNSQSSIPLDSFASLDSQLKKMKEAIEWGDRELNKLLDSTYLDPIDIHNLLFLQQDLFLFAKQLEIYTTELLNIQKGTFLPSYGLVIISQPFPDSVKQHKNIEEPVVVKLITGAKYDARPPCLIKAELINFNSKSKKNIVGIENSEKPISEKTGIAQFNDLKFPHGTRLKSIRLKFITKISVTDNNGNVHTINLESNPTNSIVVKTNENQWHEAEGILLKKTAFGGQLEISWFRFANHLQRRYLGATKQDLQNPTRPLTVYDLQYIHKIKFNAKPTINHKDFESFWEWFGPLMHKIRYQRHISALWTRGLIAGFLTREETELVLSRESIGTFLIRFSEREAQHVISYLAQTSGQTQVKHYLLKNDDTHGAKKTLPDFLYGYTELGCILQIEIQGDKRVLRRCDKNTTLREFYSKRPSGNNKGYEDVMIVTEHL